jgi:hypothetical protein
MKYLKYITLAFLVMLLVAPAMAGTNNGQYESKEAAINALNEAQDSGKCSSNECIFAYLREKYPDKKVDLLNCKSSPDGTALCVYYDYQNTKGFKGIYQTSRSTRTDLLTCGDQATLKDYYKPSENKESSNNEPKNTSEEMIQTSFSESAGTPKVDEFMEWITSGKPIYKNACREKLIEIFGQV